MQLRTFFLLAIPALALTACGSGPARRINPPTVGIQELSVAADGQWHLELRIQNFSNVDTRFSAIHATLEVAGADAGKIDLAPDIDIVGNSADVVVATLATGVKLPARGSVAYRLEGTVATSDPKGSYPFKRSSQLFPVPGIANTWR
jgi:hypothetical protein